jgi:WD40 repeat protein
MKPFSQVLLLVIVMLPPPIAGADPEPEELPIKPTHTLGGHAHVVICLDFSPDSKLLGSACWGNKAIIWDVVTGKEKARWVHDTQLYAIRFHPKNGTVFTAGWGDARVRIWELDKKEPKEILKEPIRSPGISRLVSNPNGDKLLAEVSSYHGPVLWDLKANKSKTLEPGKDPLTDVVFSPDGKRFLATTFRTVHVWDVEKEEVVGTIKTVPPDESPVKVCYSPDGKLIAGGGHQGKLWLWDAEKFTEIRSFGKHYEEVGGVQFTPDGKYLVSCAGSDDKVDGELFIWDIAAKKQLGKFAPHRAGCMSLAISPDGKWLATGAVNGEVRLWDLPALIAKFSK